MSRKKKYIYHQVIYVKHIIEDSYREQINVEDLLQRSGFSNYNFIRLFKSIYSLPPHQYLNQLKVQGAKKELIHAEFSISEISYNLGFTDKEDFVRTFIGFTGQSPTQYRKLHQIISKRKVFYPTKLELLFSYAGSQVAGLLRCQGVPSISYHSL